MAAQLHGIAQAAVDLVESGNVVGLGSGRAAEAFLRMLGIRVQQGLTVRGVATSEATASVARQVGVPLVTLDEVGEIDITVDGADEVDPRLDLIKGYGGALVREKIVAAASRRLVIVVGSEKLVPVLGSRGRLPVEVVPFGARPCGLRLAELKLVATLRQVEGRPFVTDNGNYILDCTVSTITDPMTLERAILAVPGVVGTGLFIGMADTVLIQDGERVEVRERTSL